jgi:hypothetical protein
MHASTIERPAVHQANPVRPAGSADLIRTINGAQAPAAGRWEIGSGQHLDLAARVVRTRVLPARVLPGTLIVTDDLLGSALEFTLLVSSTRTRVGFSARVTQLLSVDSWQADGTTTIAGASRPVSLRLRYNGVFRQRERQPVLWLTIHATVALPELRVPVGSWRARRLKLAADVNLHPRS